ncbi:NAD-P-binding protein [Polyporus arcularius HHB13444]|uniref:NAD-P-binding protein n=1 Tax=Polyporus arcularius HHB13444 TaxID=1314778 RepID=A0A5C3PNW7_9APHY|nr:NAD-P-binding protein [Polyporus arcularius HHB13444]
MSTKTPIFLTGATGYIGGSVLSRLLEHPSADTFDITVLVRDGKKAQILESQFGVKAVVGTHQEHDKIEGLVENAHIVFHLPDPDDVPLIQAILRGMRTRHTKLGDLPILIHTSGTGTLADDARGVYPTDTVYDDLDVEQIKSIRPDAPHRPVDLLIAEADTQGYVRAYIVLPSLIYGFATHRLVKAGVSNSISIQIPFLIRASLARKQAGMIGQGKALWPDVHIDDIADLYLTVFDTAVRDPDAAEHGWNGFYLGENGEHSWYQVSKAIGHVLVGLGISNDPEPTSFTSEELVKYFGSEEDAFSTWGSNSRARGNRGRSIGWKPRHTAEDMLKSITPEVEALVKQR